MPAASGKPKATFEVQGTALVIKVKVRGRESTWRFRNSMSADLWWDNLVEVVRTIEDDGAGNPVRVVVEAPENKPKKKHKKKAEPELSPREKRAAAIRATKEGLKIEKESRAAELRRISKFTRTNPSETPWYENEDLDTSRLPNADDKSELAAYAEQVLPKIWQPEG